MKSGSGTLGEGNREWKQVEFLVVTFTTEKKRNLNSETWFSGIVERYLPSSSDLPADSPRVSKELEV